MIIYICLKLYKRRKFPKWSVKAIFEGQTGEEKIFQEISILWWWGTSHLTLIGIEKNLWHQPKYVLRCARCGCKIIFVFKLCVICSFTFYLLIQNFKQGNNRLASIPYTVFFSVVHFCISFKLYFKLNKMTVDAPKS